MTQNNMPAINLHTYVNMLKDFSLGKANPDSFSETEKRIARELLRSGLLSNDIVEISDYQSKHSPTAISPKGAIELVSWSKFIQENSIAGMFYKNIINLMWLVTGAAIGTIISKIT